MAGSRASRHQAVERLDVASFAADGGAESGRWRLASLPRLFESEPADARGNGDEPVLWQLDGGRAELPGAGRRLPTLRVRARAAVVLECQRCLQPLPLDLVVDRTLFFVEGGEDAAAALDADSDDDVLALEPSVDARGLVEDELLLALPLVPRHAVCPVPLAVRDDGDAATPAEHPFAALAALKAPSGKKGH